MEDIFSLFKILKQKYNLSAVLFNKIIYNLSKHSWKAYLSGIVRRVRKLEYLHEKSIEVKINDIYL